MQSIIDYSLVGIFYVVRIYIIVLNYLIFVLVMAYVEFIVPNENQILVSLLSIYRKAQKYEARAMFAFNGWPVATSFCTLHGRF